MKTWMLALAGMLACGGVALATGSEVCDVARHLVYAETALPRVAVAIEERHDLKIVVLGTASSILPGAGGGRAYPAQLEVALARLLPGTAVKVVANVKPRRTAAEMMADEFNRMAVDDKPALVIWQTGTVDAIRGVEPDDFRATLDKGVEALHANGADVVLMNMQYSPRTESMIAGSVYADNMRWVALQHEVPLFDRFAIMKHWSEMGTFDLYAAGKNTDTAERVHDCIGRLLADLVVEAAKDGSAKPREIR